MSQTIAYELHEGGVPPDRVAAVAALHAEVFGLPLDRARDDVASLASRRRPMTILAHEGATLVGYKLGHERRPDSFSSWLGGVGVAWRRRGVAARLLELQHAWCREQGYATIRTKTKNTWRAMLLLDIRSGFDVIGAYTDERGEPKLILEKRLAR